MNKIKDQVSIGLWAVIRTQGAGHIEVVAHDRTNAILRYCYQRISKEVAFDHEDWWQKNAKKAHLVCQPIQVSTKHIKGVPYSNWKRPVPAESRCQWDMGHETICIQQCEANGKHLIEGHLLCGVHIKSYKKHGNLFLADPKVHS